MQARHLLMTRSDTLSNVAEIVSRPQRRLIMGRAPAKAVVRPACVAQIVPPAVVAQRMSFDIAPDHTKSQHPFAARLAYRWPAGGVHVQPHCDSHTPPASSKAPSTSSGLLEWEAGVSVGRSCIRVNAVNFGYDVGLCIEQTLIRRLAMRNNKHQANCWCNP